MAKLVTSAGHQSTDWPWSLFLFLANVRSFHRHLVGGIWNSNIWSTKSLPIISFLSFFLSSFAKSRKTFLILRACRMTVININHRQLQWKLTSCLYFYTSFSIRKGPFFCRPSCSFFHLKSSTKKGEHRRRFVESKVQYRIITLLSVAVLRYAFRQTLSFSYSG